MVAMLSLPYSVRGAVCIPTKSEGALARGARGATCGRGFLSPVILWGGCCALHTQCAVLLLHGVTLQTHEHQS